MIFWLWWLEPSAKPLHFSPIWPFNRSCRRGLALLEHLEECKHHSWLGWSQGLDPIWGKVNYSSLFGLVGGMYGQFISMECGKLCYCRKYSIWQGNANMNGSSQFIKAKGLFTNTCKGGLMKKFRAPFWPAKNFRDPHFSPRKIGVNPTENEIDSICRGKITIIFSWPLFRPPKFKAPPPLHQPPPPPLTSVC